MRGAFRVVACSTVGFAALLMAAEKPEEAIARIDAAKTVFDEIMAAPDKGIPRDLLEKAYCVAIIPGAKRAGFIVGAKYGKGVITCKTARGWSGPSTVRIEGGSFGLQIGAGETDVVMVVMNKSGAEKLMADKFTLGGEAAGMAGPVGRATQAETDAAMRAEILTYSRARGIFGGLVLNGSTLRPDNEDNTKIYGKEVAHKTILNGGVPVPAAAKPLLADIRKYTTPAVAVKKSTKKAAAAK